MYKSLLDAVHKSLLDAVHKSLLDAVCKLLSGILPDRPYRMFEKCGLLLREARAAPPLARGAPTAAERAAGAGRPTAGPEEKARRGAPIHLVFLGFGSQHPRC